EHRSQRVVIFQTPLHCCQGDETVGVRPGGDHRARNRLLEHLTAGDEKLVTPKHPGDKM
ncbi:hypothetical protein ElyMa_005925400, partial [Elysia marginata]